MSEGLPTLCKFFTIKNYLKKVGNPVRAAIILNTPKKSDISHFLSIVVIFAACKF